MLLAMLEAGFELTHVYGLTETYGPATVNEWHPEWDRLPLKEQGAKRIRQGVAYPALEQLTVLNPDTLEPVPADGETLGEVMFRGNIVMKGYLKNPKATREAMAGGWFHSGDLGVMHKDGYIQLKDRSKDIIISGGENISSIEVENALYKHPAVLFAAVVAKPDEKWGETPCAFVEKKLGHEGVSEADLIAFCRENLARFKCPKTDRLLRAAQDHHGQDPEVPLARAGKNARLTPRFFRGAGSWQPQWLCVRNLSSSSFRRSFSFFSAATRTSSHPVCAISASISSWIL